MLNAEVVVVVLRTTRLPFTQMRPPLIRGSIMSSTTIAIDVLDEMLMEMFRNAEEVDIVVVEVFVVVVVFVVLVVTESWCSLSRLWIC